MEKKEVKEVVTKATEMLYFFPICSLFRKASFGDTLTSHDLGLSRITVAVGTASLNNM
jgi:hypothetical protein